MEVPNVVLNTGHKMPVIAMGAAADPPPPLNQLVPILLDAIAAGYRHFDTAAIYGTEEALGKAVAEALDRRLINSRDELFITSKLWGTDADPDRVVPALKKSLKNLGLEYLDLYMIHWPVRLNPDGSEEGNLPLDIKNTWEAMEMCSKLGLAKSIGVSNFSSVKLTNLLKHATIPPAVNQVEVNPAWQQRKLLEFCKEKGIQVAAYSPLGGNGTFWGSNAVVESTTLKDIAAAKGKSLAQVAIRWIYEQGVVVIAKSFNKERMKQNLEIFDWELTKEELALIEEIPQKRSGTGSGFVGPDRPYKTQDQLWDSDA